MPFITAENVQAGDGWLVDSAKYTLRDNDGNWITEACFTFEFRGAYATGGLVCDFSRYFRRVEMLMASPGSGARYYLPKPNDSDFPGDPRSGRVMLINSGLVEVTNTTAVSGVRARLFILGY